MNRSTVTATVFTGGLAAVAALALSVPALAGSADHTAGPLTTYTPSPSPTAGVDAGATARAQVVQTSDGKTIMTLHASGLDGLAKYGAHAHAYPCGSSGAAAGPHFQWDVDPVVQANPMANSTDPAYANPQNELWLDLTTNPAGEGRAKAVVDRPFPGERRPGSVIIHERHTNPGNGTAGSRVACLTLTY